MHTLWNFYLNLSLKIRLAILCACYSGCIVATGAAFHYIDDPLVRSGVVGLFIVLGGCFGWINIWSINRPLQQAVTQLHTMAEGNLSSEVRVEHQNEFGTMLRSIGNLQHTMCGILSGAQEAGIQMEQSSLQIAEMSSEFAQAYSTQQERFEHVSQAAGDLGRIAESVRDCSLSVRTHADETEKEAQRGIRAVNENITMMRETVQEVDAATHETAALKGMGENIHRIVDSINDIADQTNLLALNAAIEAARAGEQGRGFAVVADEVRNLASRTARETEQIAAIIGEFGALVGRSIDSMQRVESRVSESQRKAVETSTVIERMIAVVRDSASINMQISEVSQSQMEHLADLRESLATLFGAIRDNGNKVAVTATISTDLNRLAQELTRLMGRFIFERHLEEQSVAHEKRRHPRAYNGLLAVMQGADGSRVEGITSDFSLSGIQLRLPVGTAVAKDDRVFVDLFVPRDSAEEFKRQTPLRLEARVVHATNRGDVLACGLEFQGVNDVQRQQLTSCFAYFRKPATY